MKRNIIILFPTQDEAKPFIERYGAEYDIFECGIGIAESAMTTAKVLTSAKPDIIILAGIAGAYTGGGLQKGDVVIVDKEYSADLGSVRDGAFHPLSKRGDDIRNNYYPNDTALPHIFPGVVSNTVNTAGTPLTHDTGAVIENMEGAGFFAVCRALGVPFAEIRCISNIVGDSKKDWDISQAVENLCEGLITFLKECEKR